MAVVRESIAARGTDTAGSGVEFGGGAEEMGGASAEVVDEEMAAVGAPEDMTIRSVARVHPRASGHPVDRFAPECLGTTKTVIIDM